MKPKLNKPKYIKGIIKTYMCINRNKYGIIFVRNHRNSTLISTHNNQITQVIR